MHFLSHGVYISLEEAVCWFDIGAKTVTTSFNGRNMQQSSLRNVTSQPLNRALFTTTATNKHYAYQ